MQAYKIDVRGTTEQEKKEIQDAFFKLGYRWEYSGNSYRLNSHTAYFTSVNGYLTYISEYNTFQNFVEDPRKEITVSELMVLTYGANKEFTKSDLKTGMVVKMRGGSYEANKYNGLCLVIADCLMQSDGHEPLVSYNSSLKHVIQNTFDIVEVFEVVSTLTKPLKNIQEWDLKSVWKRNELTEQLIKLNAEKDKLLLKVKEIDSKITELESK